MTLGAGALLVLIIGGIIGWFAGWIARTDDNRRYEAAFRRRVEHAELEASQAWAEVERLESRLAVPAAAAVPAINIHVTAPALPSYRDLAGAAAVALASERVAAIEGGVVDG